MLSNQSEEAVMNAKDRRKAARSLRFSKKASAFSAESFSGGWRHAREDARGKGHRYAFEDRAFGVLCRVL